MKHRSNRHPDLWPKDGSILIQFHQSATIEEIKGPFNAITQQFDPQMRTQEGKWKYKRRRRQKGQGRLKIEIYELANRPTQAGEWITVRVDPMTRWDEARPDIEEIKRSLPKRRQRVGQRRLKLKIHDMHYDEGKSFRQIAKAMGKAQSTVFDLFISVCKDIGITTEKGKLRSDPFFDLQQHWDDGCYSGVIFEND